MCKFLFFFFFKNVSLLYDYQSKPNSYRKWLHAHAPLCMTLCNPCTVAHQTPLSLGFFREEYWSGLSFPPPVGCHFLPGSGRSVESLPECHPGGPGKGLNSCLLQCRQILHCLSHQGSHRKG